MHTMKGPGLLSCFRPVLAALSGVVLLCAGMACAAQTSNAEKALPDTGEVRQEMRAARQARFLGGRRSAMGAAGAQPLERARREHAAMLAQPRASALSAAWTAVGPAQVSSALYGNVTGRVTAVALDPSDATGNTVYVGTTGGGVWKSVNAAGPVGAVVFQPLTDTLPVFSANAGSSAIPSLSIGALGVGGGVVLAGTGDPNDATDSYYGGGILRSADGGATWTLVQGTTGGTAANTTFVGLGFAGFAFSSANPQLVVAASVTAAEGTLVNAPEAAEAMQGLLYSSDAGATWHVAKVMDGNQAIAGAGGSNGAGATAVVWNAARQRFLAAVQFHGYYESSDGANWTRLAAQPGAGLTAAACPAAPASTSCPMFRGALAVQTASGDTFALSVDGANRDEGLYQDVCGLNGTACAGAEPMFGTRLASAALEQGSGSTVIAQGGYNLTLAAAAQGADTILYAGTIDLYRCSVAAGCVLRDTTNAENGCLHPAGVAPAQHALAAAGMLLFVGNDGGIYRSTDGVNETGAPCSAADAGHFDNLNGGIGSLAEVVSFAQDPVDAGTLLTGLGALGTGGTGNAGGAWAQLSAGEGGTVAIDASAPANWYLATSAGVSVGRCSKGAACAAADFAAPTIGEPQVANDVAAVHAPYLLDPGATGEMLVGTCRVWRGPAADGTLWSSANAISRALGASGAAACSATFPVVRTLAAGGAVNAASNAQNSGSDVLYAGMAGALDGGGAVGGHVFTTAAANLASNATVWTDAAKGTVGNDQSNAGLFNPGGFDLSSLAVDTHDATGKTVYATVMGFSGNGVNAAHVYRSVDGGGHWTNISANLPNAPANSVVVDPNDANTLYVALDTGVYVTTQVTSCASANCWSVFGSSLPNAPAVELAAAAGMATGDGRVGELRVATYGRGIWQVPLLTAISPAAPMILLNPGSLVFAAQQVGSLSASQTVTVLNTGNASLTVSSAVASGDFAESDTCVGAPVAQGASCTVQVRFAPAIAGARSGLLTVYGNVAGGQATAALSGTGTPAATLVLTPGSLAFAATNVGSTSAVENITLANTGGTAAGLQSETVSSDFAIAANTCATTLAAQNSCTISVVFRPTASGVRGGTLTVADDAGTQVATLTGTGTTPATDALSPGSLSFAPQQLNTASATQAVTLTNAGDVALTLIAAAITSGDFTVVNSCGNSLAAHASCTLNVAYVPKNLGAETGVLTVSDQFRSQTVSLTGTGLAPPGVSLAPIGGLSFGAVGVGLSGATQTVTLTNNGGVPLQVASTTVSGDFAVVPGTNTCGTALAPMAMCSIGVSFVPTAAGMRSGSLALSDNAGNSPQTLALTGTGVDFTLAADGATSMTVASGTPATFVLLLNAATGLPGNVVFTCAGAPKYAKCTVNPATAALGGSQVVTVTVATGTTALLQAPAMPWSERGVWLAMLLPVGVLAGWRKKRVRVALACVVLGAAAGCSQGRTIPAITETPAAPVVTPNGTYNLVVAGSSAGLVRTVNLTLVVQ